MPKSISVKDLKISKRCIVQIYFIPNIGPFYGKLLKGNSIRFGIQVVGHNKWFNEGDVLKSWFKWKFH
jgi:hypothetical protein